MEQYVTLHRIFDLIEDYQKQSPILNTFGYGNIVDFQKNTSGYTVEYPYIFVTPQTVSYDENTTTYQLSIIFGDQVNTDLSNEKDVVSDMSIEAKRFLSYIKRGNLFPFMEVNLPANGLTFFERFNDHVGGVALTLDVIVLEDINACDYYEPAVSPTPTVTPTQTCTTTTQYLEVQLQDNTKFKLVLWNQPDFSSPATALCDYQVSGIAYGDLGTVYPGVETIDLGQHQHQFDLAPVLLPGEIVTGFTVNSVSTSACTCPVIVLFTPYQTPTPTPTTTNTPTPTITPTVTPTPSATPAVCYDAGLGFSAGAWQVMATTGSTVYVGGGGLYDTGVTTEGLYKLNADLSKDATFNSGGIAVIPSSVGGYRMSLDVGGTITVIGTFTTVQSTSRNRMVRLYADTGLIDTSFDFGGGAGIGSSPNAFVSQSDGKYVVGGTFTTVNGVSTNRIVRLNNDGSTDGTFTVGTGFNSTVQDVVQQSDGKYIISGGFATYNGTAVSRVCRLNTDGTLDATFAPVFPTIPTNCYKLAVLSDDSIVGIMATAPYVFKLSSAGVFDTTFETNVGTGCSDSPITNGWVEKLPFDQVMVTGTGVAFNDSYAGDIVILNSNGTRDTTKFTSSNFGNVTGAIRPAQRTDNNFVITANAFFFDTQLINRIVVTDSNGNGLMC